MLQPSVEQCFLWVSKGAQSSWGLEPDISIFSGKLIPCLAKSLLLIFRIYIRKADSRLVKWDSRYIFSFPTGFFEYHMLLPVFKVPAEPLCKNVPGPPISCHQPDFCTAVGRLDPAMYVWWKPPFWPPGFFLSADATHACGQRSSGTRGTCQIRQIVDWNSYEDHNSWVSWKCFKLKYQSIL